MASPAARAIADKQRHYDRLHHEKRVEWLQTLTKPDWAEREMLKQSLAVLRDTSGMYGSRSVDLSDDLYLKELDAFLAQKTQLAAAE